MFSALSQHPVTRAEMHYQVHLLNTSRAGVLWIVLAVALLVPALVLSVIVFGVTLLYPLFPNAAIAVFTFLNTFLNGFLLGGIVLTMNVAQFFVVSLVTLALAMRSITREMDGQTWDLLLLTNADARRIVRGKWWATLRVLGRDNAAVAILRIGLVSYILFSLNPIISYPPLPPGVSPLLTFSLFFAVLLVVYTALETAVTVALGVMAPLISTTGGLGGTIALGARLVVTAAVVIVPFWMTRFFPNGSLLPFILGGVLVVALQLPLLWAVWRVAEWFVMRGQLISNNAE